MWSLSVARSSLDLFVFSLILTCKVGDMHPGFNLDQSAGMYGIVWRAAQLPIVHSPRLCVGYIKGVQYPDDLL